MYMISKTVLKIFLIDVTLVERVTNISAQFCE